MDLTALVVALIGVAGIALGGGIGVCASLWSARVTTDGMLRQAKLAVASDREHRLWEKRAEVYLRYLAYANYQAAVRRATMIPSESRRPVFERIVKTEAANYTPPSRYELDAALAAFASDAVRSSAARLGHVRIDCDLTWADYLEAPTPEAMSIVDEAREKVESQRRNCAG